jgi:two-component sensor histidine kinase/CHASE3 domain sensor protein
MPISVRFVVQSTIGLLGVGFLTLLAIVGMTIWLNERAQNYFNDVVEARTTRTAAVELRSALQTAESSQRGFLIGGNEIYLAPYDKAKTEALSRLETLKHLLSPYKASEVMMQRLSELVAAKVAEMDRINALKADRREDEAMAMFRTNRGKALTDEANVFLTGIVSQIEERLEIGIEEQRVNAQRVRWVSIVGALVIVLVVGGVVTTFGRYAQEVRQARDEVRAVNAGLEARVERRTADLSQERDRAEVLLAEVNHRVANSLTLVASLVKLQANAVRDPAAKDALNETHARIFAISLIHKRLYTSGDVRFVALDEYLAGLLEHLETSMRAGGHGAALKYDLEPLKLRTDASVNLAVIVTEWVTNAFKYAYPEGAGQVRVSLKRSGEQQAELTVADDGVGRGDGTAKGTGLGSRLVTAIAGTMGAKIDYLHGQPGTTARLVFPLLSA